MPNQPSMSAQDTELDTDTQVYQHGKQLTLIEKRCTLPYQDPIFDGQYWQEQQAVTGRATGRGTTLFFVHAQRELILRQYLRGGLPGKLLKDQFWFTGFEQTRAWQEFFLLKKLRAMGLPAPTPVAANVTRSGLIYRNSIIIERIPTAKDLHAVLFQKPLPNNTWRHIGETIKAFHRLQVYHCDLNMRNIMLDSREQAWLIDFDKCAIRPSDRWKASNLQRLHRSFSKEKLKTPTLFWDENAWEELLSGYHSQN